MQVCEGERELTNHWLLMVLLVSVQLNSCSDPAAEVEAELD